MPLVEPSTYRAPWLYRSGHLQTILPTLDPRIRADVGISVPCELEECSRRLERAENRLYMMRFMRLLREKIRRKARNFPGAIDPAPEMPRHGGHVGFLDFRGDGSTWGKRRGVAFCEAPTSACAPARARQP